MGVGNEAGVGAATWPFAAPTEQIKNTSRAHNWRHRRLLTGALMTGSLIGDTSAGCLDYSNLTSRDTENSLTKTQG